MGYRHKFKASIHKYKAHCLRSSQRDLYVVPPWSISTNFYGKRSFVHAAPELWNGIPNDIKRVGTIEGFKTSLK